MKIEFNDNVGYVVLFITIAVTIIFVCDDIANAADYAIVSFNDAEHLAALQDSVVDICDTVGGYYYNPDCPGDTVWYNKKSTPPHPYRTVVWLPNCDGSKSLLDSTYQVNWRYVDKAITRRQLVCVTIDPHPIKMKDVKCIPCPVIPGEAIIFYEPYREEQCIK